VTDAMTVGDDPVLDSLGAFLAASLLAPPSSAPLAVPAVSPPAAPVPWGSALVIEPLPPAAPPPAAARPVPTFVPEPAEPAVPQGPPPDVGSDVDPHDSDDSDDYDGPSRLRVTLEWVAIIAGALAIAIVLRVVVIQSFEIPSESMHPTLQNGDRVLVNRLAYKAHDIRRGDVIVFDKPATHLLDKDTPAHLIKRVIGLPGDTIVARDGIVYIDGRRLREPYLPSGTLTENLNTSVTIPAGHVWVMGDNRMNSTDSRIFGAIDVKLVVGRAFARIWPPSRIGFL
jgi:signal peptidase I